MEQGKIKLRPKQLAAIAQIQAQKAQLNQAFQELNKNESLILELLLEENNISASVNNVKLDGEFITFEIVEATTKPKGKLKKLAEPKTES